MEDQETTIITNVTNSRPVRGFLAWFAMIATIVTLGVVSYGVWLMRAYVPIIGLVWLAAIGLVPIIGLVYGLVYLVRLFYQGEVIHVGSTGAYRERFGRLTPLSPLTATAARPEKATKVTPVIPKLAELLVQGALGSADLLLGYHADGSPRWGLWSDIRTFCIAGKGRSGKTITMFFLIVQALLSGAVVWLCDPHYNKKSSITALLQPLSRWLRIAGSDDEIVRLVSEFVEEMEMRVEGRSTMQGTPMLLVIDEFTRLISRRSKEEGELIASAVIACAEEYAGFDGYAMIAGHEWSDQGQGQLKSLFAKLRRALHAIYCHRLDADYAKFLLNSAKYSKLAPALRTGHSYLQDSEGQIDQLITPLGTIDDAATVATMLAALPLTAEYPQLQQGTRTDEMVFTSPVNYPQPLQLMPVSESGNAVKQTMKLVNTGEASTSPSESSVDVSLADETAILHTALLLQQEKGRFSRSDIRDRLNWNNKQWPVIKAVCDKYSIAC